ncbi:MAG TPA: hypothetical protein VFS26_09220 [Solirubrobacterales bacterium]|nr:hypothetical protein [Solirubrobacterales bacterium]
MLVFVFVVWQALGFPEVEDPIPDRIGFGSIVGLAGAGGVVGGILSVVAWPRRREQFISLGALVGFCAGSGFYALSLFVQLLSSGL